ncbi:MAG: galactose mutarotase [Thermoclostridium sp.]|nr:galactose mutarotase [Thermoclostridium sp.]
MENKKLFGKTPDGAEAALYTLENRNGMKAKVTNYGGIIVSLFVPDKNGKLEDVVLGCENLENTMKMSPFFGALIGRHANRIENAQFELNGKEYKVLKNDGNNHLHGGARGFDKVFWEVVGKSENTITLSYHSADGEEGYPGNLDVTVTYSLSDDNALSIDYMAKSDKDTVINLTNHSYFNLSGHACGDIVNHELKIYADQFTVNNDECIPTGEILPVSGTAMDFTDFRPLKPGLMSQDPHIKCGKGYDHNFIIKRTGKSPELCAEAYDPASGRRMQVYTTKPGVQLYTGNHLNDGMIGKGGVRYRKWSGFCLETQFFPNAMKHKHFPSPVLKAGEVYHHITTYKFL